MASSQQVTCGLIPISGGGGPTEFVTGETLGSSRSEGYTVGFKFTTSTSITVSRLARIRVAGNTSTITVKLKDSSGVDVTNGSVAIDMSSGTLDAFKYANLSSPPTLSAGTYYLVSVEPGTGDLWYDEMPFTHTAIASVVGSVYDVGGGLTVNTSGDYMYVGLDFTYA